MALQSVSDDLLIDWDNWSRGATNYEADACAQRWRTFKNSGDRGGIGIGTLGLLAKQNGWRLPFVRNASNRSSHPLVRVDKNDCQTLSLSEDLEDAEELAEEVQSLVKLTEEVAPVQSLLSPHLTIPLMHLANQFNVPLEAFVGVLLPVAAALLRVDTCIEIDANTGFCSPAILWTGLVGESGATKSPIFNSLLNPLEKLQAEADADFRLAFAQYKEELDDLKEQPKDGRRDAPTEPVPKEYYLQDATMEAIADCLSKQPDRGIIVAVDELAGLFAAFNQYRAHGRGNDRQKWLSAYDGKPLKVNRKTGSRISVPRTAVSVTGTIQHSVLRKQMGNLEEVDGFWSRFFWISLPLTKMPPPGEGANHNLSGLLQSLYKALENLPPENYQLDSKGRQIWKKWHCFCEEQKVSESSSPLRSLHPKAKERAARIALVAHCINALVEGRLPEVVVSSETLEAAIAFTEWLIGQTRLIYADSGITIYPDSPKIVRFVERFKGHGWISARQVTHWSTSREKLRADAARAFMKQVAGLGYAIDNGKTGRAYQICIRNDSSNVGNNGTESPLATSVEIGNNGANKLVTNGGIKS